MERETLEEVLPKNSNGKYSRNEIEKAFELGTKWQVERMYSEEEKELMIKIFHTYWFENNPEHEDNLKEWELSKKLFEQFKKK
jgi:hypothetical protein